MTTPLIQVVIPTHNRAWALQRAIDSVRRQTLTDWRLTIVDDGSTDATRELVESVQDPRIDYLYQEHAGVSAARNRGWQSTDSCWVAFLDSDDAWQADKLQRQLEALETDCRYGAIYTDEIWIRNGRRVNQGHRHRKRGGWIFNHCLPLCIISPSSILLSRPLLTEQDGFDPGLEVCEDYDLWLRLTASHPILYLPELLITKYGGHDDQLSGSRWGMDLYRLRSLENLWQSGRLSFQQRVWTVQEAIRKAEIVAAGFSRRNKPEEGAEWEATLRRWRDRASRIAARGQLLAKRG